LEIPNWRLRLLSSEESFHALYLRTLFPCSKANFWSVGIVRECKSSALSKSLLISLTAFSILIVAVRINWLYIELWITYLFFYVFVRLVVLIGFKVVSSLEGKFNF
jgi:hypothetical protein